MINTYIALRGQSIYDICLQTYGDLNLLFKLLIDNNVSSINNLSFAGALFIFDTDLIIDNSLFNRNKDEDIFYSTQLSISDLSKIGKSFDESFDISFR